VFRERYHGKPNAIPAALSALGVALLLWRLRPFRVAVEGRSMAPTLLPGDLLVATVAGRARTGEVVVVEHPDRPGYEIVKRLAASPGQRVDGVRMGPDECWVLGDDPSSSTDSRAFGPVPFAAVVGVVRLRYWPPHRLALVCRRARLAPRTGSFDD
jgi:inner membrane protease subunit 1